MSQWETYEFEERIRAILRDFQNPENKLDHLGQPFVSPYQIAIAYAERHPDAFQKLKIPIGGRGTSVSSNLTQYIAGELSTRIKSGEIEDIEGGWLRRNYVKQIDFTYQNETITAPGNPGPLSMFRLRVD